VSDASSPEVPPRFEVRSLLGRGGLGRVYAAFDRDRSEPVAIKLLERRGPEEIASIKREFRALRGLVHPNLVGFHELIAHEGLWFFTMELVEGRTLLEHLRGDAPDDLPTIEGELPASDAPPEPAAAPVDTAALRDAITQLARGLAALHEAGRVHRDVKPSNVLVSPRGRVVLVDFGLALETDAAGRGGGTPRYMAPEQLDAGHSVTPAADVYSLGAILYESLTGHGPFGGGSSEVVAGKLFDDPPPPVGLDPGAQDLGALAVAMLAREPEARPTMPEVLARLEGRAAPRPSIAPPAGAPLIGREPILVACVDAWADARRAGPVTIALTGPDGSGRSRALDEVLARLAASGAPVLRARCDGRESIPYRGLDQIVDALVEREAEADAPPLAEGERAWVAALFPTVARLWPAAPAAPPASPVLARRRGFLALRQWLRARAPLVIALDDAHALDGDGLALLSVLASASELSVLFLLAARERPPLVARELPLRALDVTEMAELAASLGLSPGHVDRADGLPGRLIELARGADDPFVERLAALGPDARTLLTLCALAPGPVPIDLAAKALRLAPEDVLAPRRTLGAAHLLRSGPRGLSPISEPIRDAALAGAPDDTKRALGKALGEAISRRPGANLGDAARCLEVAGRPAQAARFAKRALREAEAGLAFERVAALRAQLARVEPAQRAAHIEARGRALGRGGRPAEAADAFLEASSLAADAGAARDLRRRAAEELLRAGHVARGRALLAGVLGDLGLPMPRDALRALPGVLLRRARLLLRGTAMKERAPTARDLAELDACWTATAFLVIDIYLGAYFQTLHLARALDAGDPARAASALAMEVPLLAAAGRARAAARVAREARGLARRSGDPRAQGMVDTCVGFAFLQQGQFGEALRGLTEGEATIQRTPAEVSWELTTARVARAWALAMLGDLRGLRAYVQEIRAVSEARGDRLAWTYFGLGPPTYAWLIDDEVARAREVADTAIARWPLSGFQTPHLFALVSRALIALHEGAEPAALDALDAAWPTVRRSLMLQNQLLRVTLHDLRARLALAAGRPDRAREDAARLAREDALWASALASLVLAQLERSEARYAEAASRFARAGMAMHEAAARHALGEPFERSSWASTHAPAAPRRLLASLVPGAPL